jgi:hypothetical protein
MIMPKPSVLDLVAFSAASMAPAENVKPRCPSRAATSAMDSPVSSAWITNSSGATKMNANSIGSVIPVTNATSAAEIMMPPTARRRCGGAARQMATAAAGSPNMMTGKNPAMNSPAPGAPCR